MQEGGGHVMHDNIDWGPAMDLLPALAQFRAFDAPHTDTTDIDLSTLKLEARDAVRAGLERGYAALVWQPMSVEMEESHHHGFCWGLIVGYNEKDETYTIRHPYVSETYTVCYDAIGHTGAEWFHVQVVDFPKDDERSTHVTALRNAVAFAHQTRFAADDKRNAKRRARPHGFFAYEVWVQAFESEDVPLETSRHHAEVLKGRRNAAGTYLRELFTIFPEATESLEAAAAHYDCESDSLNPLYELCAAAREREAWTNEERASAGALIGEALKADRDAITEIETALSLIEGLK